MSSDSRNNKQDFHGNVVPIRSGEDGTESDRKLAAARRLFSLHEYGLCEQIVQEVLAVDPHSSKAKALLELASIKLSKRKLYKKMVDPKQPSRLVEPPHQIEPLDFDGNRNPRRAETSNREAGPPPPTQVRATEGTHPPAMGSNRRPLQVRSEAAGEKPSGFSTTSIRERTIAAMVELLRDRNKGLGDWKDPRFGIAPPEHTSDGAESPSFDSGKATIPIPPLHEPILEPSPGPRFVFVKEEETQVVNEKVPQNRPEEGSTSPVNFLPGSLAELFETTGDLHEEQLTEPEIKAKRTEIAPLPVSSAPEEVPSSLTELFKTTGDFHNEQLREHETKRRHVEMAPLEVPPIPDESPAVHLEEAVLPSPPVDHHALKTAKTEARPGTDRDPHDFTLPFNMEPPPLQERIERVVHLPNVNVFDRITLARETPPHEFIDRKLEQRSEEIRNSEIKAVSIAQIKKYLYQEQYELCSQELEKIRGLFPQNAEIQAFAENTSRRLVDLKAMKSFEGQAKEFMRSAVSFYQAGKFLEALDAAQQVLQVNPNHTQAHEFVEFVQRRINPEEKKEFDALLDRYCKNCGTSLDSSSQFCHHCGKRLA
jgi:hypothetical protein